MLAGRLSWPVLSPQVSGWSTRSLNIWLECRGSQPTGEQRSPPADAPSNYSAAWDDGVIDDYEVTVAPATALRSFRS
jgi:hypothetical protein